MQFKATFFDGGHVLLMSCVPFILKLAGQSEAAIYEPEFNTVLTCDRVLATLDGQLSAIRDVVSWLDEHRNNQPILGALPEG